MDRPSNGDAGVYRDDRALVGASGVDESQPPEGTLLHVVVHSAQHLPKRDGERLTADPWDDGTFATWEVGPGREQKQRFDEEVMTGGDVIQASVELSVVGGYVSEHDDPSVPYVTYEEWERARPLASHTSAVDLEGNGLLPVWSRPGVSEEGQARLCCVAWNPDFAFLRLVVYRQRASRPGGGRRPIGYEVIPLRCLREGFRSVRLRSPSSGSRIHDCVMLVEILKRRCGLAPSMAMPPRLSPTAAPEDGAGLEAGAPAGAAGTGAATGTLGDESRLSRLAASRSDGRTADAAASSGAAAHSTAALAHKLQAALSRARPRGQLPTRRRTARNARLLNVVEDLRREVDRPTLATDSLDAFLESSPLASPMGRGSGGGRDGGDGGGAAISGETRGGGGEGGGGASGGGKSGGRGGEGGVGDGGVGGAGGGGFGDNGGRGDAASRTAGEPQQAELVRQVSRLSRKEAVHLACAILEVELEESPSSSPSPETLEPHLPDEPPPRERNEAQREEEEEAEERGAGLSPVRRVVANSPAGYTPAAAHRARRITN